MQALKYLFIFNKPVLLIFKATVKNLLTFSYAFMSYLATSWQILYFFHEKYTEALRCYVGCDEVSDIQNFKMCLLRLLLSSRNNKETFICNCIA